MFRRKKKERKNRRHCHSRMILKLSWTSMICLYVCTFVLHFRLNCLSRCSSISALSRNLLYTGAAQRDVHLTSLRARDSAFVSVKDILHRPDMSRLNHVSFEKKKKMADLVLKLFTTGNSYCRWHRNKMLKLSLQSICAVLARSARMTHPL